MKTRCLLLSLAGVSLLAAACTSEITETQGQGQAVTASAEVVDCTIAPDESEKAYYTKWGKSLCDAFNDPTAISHPAAEVNKLIGKGKRLEDKRISLAEATAISGYSKSFYSKLNPSKPEYVADQCSFNPFNEVLERALTKLGAGDSPYAYLHEVYRGIQIDDATKWKAFVDANQPGKEVVFDRFTSTSCVKEMAFSNDADPAREDASKRETECQKNYFEHYEKPGRNEGFDGNVHITIAKRTTNLGATAIYSLAERTWEAEVAFPAGSRFEVTDAKVVDGQFLVTYKQIEAVPADRNDWTMCPPKK